MKETAGNLLKNAREEKNIPLSQAARETNITSRHLKSLEENNFSVFPGETYVIGFLRKYSDYLEINSSDVIQLYKGSQLIEKEPPIEELTRPTVTPLDHMRKFLIPGIVVLLIAGLSLAVFNSFNSANTDNTDNSGNDYSYNEILKKSDRVPGIETDHINFRSGYTTAIVSRGNGIDFSIENSEIYLVLKRLEYQTGEGNKSEATFEYFPGKKLIRIKEGEKKKISEENQPRSFLLKMTGATPNNVKITISLGEEMQEANTENANDENQNNRVTNPSNFIIVLNAEFTSNNFVEFYVDGKPRKKGMLSAGSILQYEANESIQMKIGDAGAVNLSINGEKYALGKKGQTIKKIIRKIKDPIEQTRYKIVIKDL